MVDESPNPVVGKAVWVKHDEGWKPNPELCLQGLHTWIAVFLESGRLAYWECAGCGEKDRDIGALPERLDTISGWIENPPVLMSRGLQPVTSTRIWETASGGMLEQGDPSSIHFLGNEIPELSEAHTFVKYGENGTVEKRYEPYREQPFPYRDHYWLTRYQVIDTDLVRFTSHCFEDSTYEIPNTSVPKQHVILSGLRRLPDR